MPQAQTGSQRSIPKLVRVNADARDAVIYKNLGNGRRVPFQWSVTVDLASAAEVVVASGISFSDWDVREALVQVTPWITSSGTALSATNEIYVKKDAVSNKISVGTLGTLTGSVYADVQITLGNSKTFTSTSSNMLWKTSGSTSNPRLG